MKITVNRLLETAKLLQTEAGKQLTDLVEYTNTAFEQIIRALRNGLNFQDNINCKISIVELSHGVAQVVSTDGKTPVGIIPQRVISTTTGIDSFIWYIDQAGKLQVKANFVGSPSEAQKVSIIILF